jgi:chemotaxis protein CheX
VLVDVVHAWVDVHGLVEGRVLLSTEERTAQRIAKALLRIGPEEKVGDADVVDALREMANIVGGNVRALSPNPGSMALPKVSHQAPVDDSKISLHQLTAAWRGHPVCVSVWAEPE